MNHRPADSLNWIQEADGLGMIAKDWQAEVEQEMDAVSLQRASRTASTRRLSWQRVLAIIRLGVGIHTQASRPRDNE